jgi:hypothetical protein
VLSICVEVCSAVFYLDDDPGVLIGACLFGDGAAAAVLTRDPAPGRRRVEWLFRETQSSPQDRDSLGLGHHGGLLRCILSPSVPEIAAQHVETVLAQVLKRHGVTQSNISAWVLHAGGNQVLKALRGRLGLTEEDTALSASILNEYGNLSSPFVLYVLRERLAQDPHGGLWFLALFRCRIQCAWCFAERKRQAVNDRGNRASPWPESRVWRIRSTSPQVTSSGASEAGVLEFFDAHAQFVIEMGAVFPPPTFSLS